MKYAALVSLALMAIGCDDYSYRLGGAETEGNAGGSGQLGAGGGSARDSGAGGVTGVGGGDGVGGAAEASAGPYLPAGMGGRSSAPPDSSTCATTGLGEGGPLVNCDREIGAVLADDQNLYFTTRWGSVWRSDHAGHGVEKLAESEAHFLEADATHLYWTTSNEIRRVAKSGGPAEVVTVFKGQSPPTSTLEWLALDESYVYCSTYEDRMLVRAAKSGGPYEVLAHSEGDMGGIAVHDDTLYWADYLQGAVRRVDLANSSDELFLPMGGAELRVAGGALWFATEIEPGNLDARLVRASFGGEVTEYPVPSYLLPFANDDLHMYWAYGSLYRIDLASGTQEDVADVPAEKLALTADWVFFSNAGQIFRLAKPPPCEVCP